MGRINQFELNPAGDKFVAATPGCAVIFDTNFVIQGYLSGHYGLTDRSGFVIPWSYTCPNIIARWSPDGTKVATVSDDKALIIWNAATYKQLARIPFIFKALKSEIYWKPDGSKIAVAHDIYSRAYLQNDSNLVEVWDTRSYTLQRTYSGTFDRNSFTIDNPWHPSKPLLLLMKRDSASPVSRGVSAIVWNIETGDTTVIAKNLPQGIGSYVTWSPSGAKIALIVDTKFTVFDGVTYQPMSQLPDSAYFIRDTTFRHANYSSGQAIADIDWSPNEEEVVISCSGSPGTGNSVMAVLYNVQQNRATVISERTTLPFFSVQWSPDGSKFAIEAQYQGILIFNGKTGAQVGEIPVTINHFPDYYYESRPTFSWTKDSKNIIAKAGDFFTTGKGTTADGIVMYNVAVDSIVKSQRVGYSISFNALAITDDKSKIFTVAEDGIIVWNTKKSMSPSVVTTPDDYRYDNSTTIALNPDGKYISILNNTLWDVGASKKTLICPTNQIIQLFNPKKPELLAFSEFDTTAYLWDYLTTRLLRSIKLPYRPKTFSWNPQGTILAIDGRDTVSYLVNTETGEVMSLFTDKRNYGYYNNEFAPDCLTMRWSPDGKILAIHKRSDDSSFISIWDTQSGLVRGLFASKTDSLQYSKRHGITDIQWNLEGTALLVAHSKKSFIIDAATGNILIERDISGIQAAWLPSGEPFVINEDFNNTLDVLRLINLQTGACTDTLIGHYGEVSRRIWTTDGKELITTSRDGTARIWYLNATGANGAEEKPVPVQDMAAILEIFPNPTENILRWNILDGTATIINVMGQKVMELSASAQQADVSGLAAGVYVLTVRTSAGAVSRTFVKE